MTGAAPPGVRRPHVLRRALESPAIVELGELGSDPDSVEELGDWLEVQQPRSSEIVRISIQHNQADLAFLLANAVTDAYLQEAYRARAEELEKRVDQGDGPVAFSMFPVTVDQLMEIADADAIMPPKSTWFEPKLRDGLLTHLITD